MDLNCLNSDRKLVLTGEKLLLFTACRRWIKFRTSVGWEIFAQCLEISSADEVNRKKNYHLRGPV